MVKYSFICHDCKLIFSKWYERIPKRGVSRKRCPECNKLCEQDYSRKRFHDKTNPGKIGKSNVKDFYNDAIDHSKEYLDKQKSPYRQYVMDEKYWRDKGAKKLTDKEFTERNKRRKKLTEDAHKRINKDPRAS